jgi:hypothetical protein
VRTTAVSLLLAGIGWLSLPIAIRADTPLPPPKLAEVWSPNKHYCAVMDPRSMTTTVYRAGPGTQRTKIWAMYGWFRVAHLANDGDHFVAGHPGINLLPLDVQMDDVLIYFFRRGELIRTVLLRDLVPRQDRLKKTASHYLWGSYLGLDAQGRYVVETVDKRKLVFDVRSGRPALAPTP